MGKKMVRVAGRSAKDNHQEESLSAFPGSRSRPSQMPAPWELRGNAEGHVRKGAWLWGGVESLPAEI